MRVVLALAMAVLVAACGSEPQETEVLGVVLERSPTDAPSTSEVTEEVETTSLRLPEPATVVHPSAQDEAEEPETEPVQRPAPQPQPEPQPEPETVVWSLPSGSGEGGTVWSVTEDPDTGDRQWVETSSTQIERVDDAPDRNPLRVNLVAAEGARDAPQRTAVCAGGVHADDEVAVDARGTIEVSLLIDGTPVQTTRTRVDVLIDPNSGIAAAQETAPVVVDLVAVSQVSCSVTFRAN